MRNEPVASTQCGEAIAPPDSLLNCECDLDALADGDFGASVLVNQMATDRNEYGDLRDCYQRLVEWTLRDDT